jgi:hypothetical protein
VVGELKGAEAAFEEVTTGGAFAGGTAEVVKAGGEEDDGEAKAAVDKEQFVEFEAEHYGV